MSPAPPTTNDLLDVVEVFSSIQGEGPLVGVRQLFLRLSGCDVRCAYCDTRHDNPPREFTVENPSTGAATLVNPVFVRDIVTLIRKWEVAFPGLHHSLSITGGEPLLHAPALVEWLPELRALLPIYLETSGLHVSQLRSVVDLLDFISMDIKLPSVAGIAPQWDLHREFLQVARSRDVYVKIVVGQETPECELLSAARVVAEVDSAITVVLQPVTAASGEAGVSGDKALRFQEIASGVLSDVRVIPQTHRFLKVL